MEIAIGAAEWAVRRALGPVSDGLLESWAASSALGPNIRALKLELLYAQGMLDNARGRDICSQALAQLLLELRQLAYCADDVLDELEYFRIQDELDGTYEATDPSAGGVQGGGGLVRGLVLNSRHTARSIAGKLICTCAAAAASNGGDPDEVEPQSGLSAAAHAVGKHLSYCSLPSVVDDGSDMPGNERRRFLCVPWSRSKAPQVERVIVHAPKLKFDRVKMSRRMTDIIEKLKPVCSKVATILGLEPLVSRSSTKTPLLRNITTPVIVEPYLYGRETQKSSVVHDIVHGRYSAHDLTVLPIVGPGGIGKTTFTQHLYAEMESHFQVSAWICVSQNFNRNKLEQEVLKKTREGKNDDQTENVSYQETVEKRIKSKRFLLVFDDMWTYHEYEWKKLLASFKKGGAKGNMVIVTTRIPEVAKMAETMDCTIKLEPLDPEDYIHLFKASVFGDKQSWEDHCELHQVGEQIMEKLKGSPLAARTVGRLLRNNLDLDHWTRVLESKEWEHQTNDDDIMPALKLSYDYLSFPLQQCFSHCGLFPEDYEFKRDELVHLWIGLGLLGICEQNKRPEDLGLSYFADLVNHGFFEMDEKQYDEEDTSYVIHDLLHELAINVSSYECLSINKSTTRTIQIPASIRHLSIIIDNADVKDRMTFENHKRHLSTLSKRINAENLRTLMLFGENHGSFYKIFADLLRKAKSLRVIFLSEVSYNLEDLFVNFAKLVHLRYLRIIDADFAKVTLPSSISRFYHLMVLDVRQCTGKLCFLTDVSNLVNLRHFVVSDRSGHIFPEAGKLKYLQKLTTFEVKTEIGFELKQLGGLLELQGSLDIYNLEKAMDEAKIENIKHISGLSLHWSYGRNKDPKREESVLESLRPHRNIRELCISGHGGVTLPTWLSEDLSTNSLESLRLEDVAWNKLLLVGDLCMVSEHGGECPGCVTGQGFQNLKRLELVFIPTLKKWRGNGTGHLLSHLEELIIMGCFGLLELPISQSTTCHQTEQVESKTFFPKLRMIHISGCPKLSPLPPFPWTQSICDAMIQVSSGVELEYLKDQKYRSRLKINGKDTSDSIFWNVLDFNNLTEVQILEVVNCPPVSLGHLKMLESLEDLSIENSSNVLRPDDCDSSNVQYELSVENLWIDTCGANGKELTELLSHCPNLTKPNLTSCEKVTGLGVMQQQEMGVGNEEMEGAAADEGLLLLPPQIKRLDISICPELSMVTAGGLQGLHSLRSFCIWQCPKFHFSNSASSCHFPFPSSLQELQIEEAKRMEMLGPFSNLTNLVISSCGDLTSEGLWPLLAQGHLTELTVYGAPRFLAGLKQQPFHHQSHLRHSCRLRVLRTDDTAGVLVAPICDLVSSSLTTLELVSNNGVEQLTEEQEEALKMVTSLKEITFWGYEKLRSLPAVLSTLPSLERLVIAGFEAILSLANGSLPSSLQYLDISYCPKIQSIDGLPSSLQELHVTSCASLKSLPPKDSLPSSLRVLHVTDCKSMELKRHCRKLKGTIPIINA